MILDIDKPDVGEHTENMRDVAEPPKFEHKIPDELLDQWHKLDPVMKVVLREQSIQRQQTEWIMQRYTTDLPALQRDMESIKKLRDILTAKWSVVAFILMTLAVPSAMLLLGALVSKHFGK